MVKIVCKNSRLNQLMKKFDLSSIKVLKIRWIFEYRMNNYVTSCWLKLLRRNTNCYRWKREEFTKSMGIQVILTLLVPSWVNRGTVRSSDSKICAGHGVLCCTSGIDLASIRSSQSRSNVTQSHFVCYDSFEVF